MSEWAEATRLSQFRAACSGARAVQQVVLQREQLVLSDGIWPNRIKKVNVVKCNLVQRFAGQFSLEKRASMRWLLSV